MCYRKKCVCGCKCLPLWANNSSYFCTYMPWNFCWNLIKEIGMSVSGWELLCLYLYKNLDLLYTLRMLTVQRSNLHHLILAISWHMLSQAYRFDLFSTNCISGLESLLNSWVFAAKLKILRIYWGGLSKSWVESRHNGFTMKLSMLLFLGRKIVILFLLYIHFCQILEFLTLEFFSNGRICKPFFVSLCPGGARDSQCFYVLWSMGRKLPYHNRSKAWVAF